MLRRILARPTYEREVEFGHDDEVPTQAPGTR
jgi:hypothetical protein